MIEFIKKLLPLEMVIRSHWSADKYCFRGQRRDEDTLLENEDATIKAISEAVGKLVFILFMHVCM